MPLLDCDEPEIDGGPCGCCPGWAGPLTAWRCGECNAGECEACGTWSPSVVDAPATVRSGATIGHRLCVAHKAEHDADVAAMERADADARLRLLAASVRVRPGHPGVIEGSPYVLKEICRLLGFRNDCRKGSVYLTRPKMQRLGLVTP